jgi:hypothetical protein
LVHELICGGQVTPVPTRITVHRVLVIHDLIDLRAHRRTTFASVATLHRLSP